MKCAVHPEVSRTESVVRGRTPENLTGQRFGCLVALELAARCPTRWLCRCDCGKSKVIFAHNLKAELTTSCGCVNRLLSIERFTTHGLSKSVTYKAWLHMRERCLNPKDKCYPDWGGRGITVCSRWLHSFENFLSDMGEKPPGLSLGRIDNDGNYTPKNCRWETHSQQMKNRRPFGSSPRSMKYHTLRNAV